MTGRTFVLAAAAASVFLGGAVRGEERGYVRVRVIEGRGQGRVAYRYAVENNDRDAIVAFQLGAAGGHGKPQLRQPPFGWTGDRGLPLGSAVAPDGWSVEAVRDTNQPLWFVEWSTSETDESLDIAPGQVRDGFGLIVVDSDPAYATGSWTVIFENGRRASGRLERDDR